MLVKLDKCALWPYYEESYYKEYHGHRKPDFEVEIPDDLWGYYVETKKDFFGALQEIKEYLKDE